VCVPGGAAAATAGWKKLALRATPATTPDARSVRSNAGFDEVTVPTPILLIRTIRPCAALTALAACRK
jgi:hypothetical protein